MTIVEIQESVIDTLTDSGFTNVRDSLLLGLTQSEQYPVVVVDLEFSMLYQTARGGYTPYAHFLSISVYQKASIGIEEARQSAAENLDDALNTLGLSIFNDKIMYKDTVLNNIKVCCAYAIVECSSYVENTYKPSLGISSSIDDCVVLFNGEETQYTTPCVIKKANSGTYTVEKEGYNFSNIVVDLSDRKDDSIHFEHNLGQLNSPTIVFNEDDGKCYITTDIDVDNIFYTLDGTDPTDESEEYDSPFYIDSCEIRTFARKRNYQDSNISTLSVVVPFIKIVNSVNDTVTRLKFSTVKISTFVCGGGIQISNSNSTGFSDSLLVGTGTRTLYVKIIDDTIPGYLYVEDGVISTLGISKTGNSLGYSFYAYYNNAVNSDIGDIYIYMKRLYRAYYMGLYASYLTKIFVCGEILEDTQSLLYSYDVYQIIDKQIPDTIEYIYMQYVNNCLCNVRMIIPSSLKYFYTYFSFGFLFTGQYPYNLSYIYAYASAHDIRLSYDSSVRLVRLHIAYSCFMIDGTITIDDTCSIIYNISGGTKIISNSPLPSKCSCVYFASGLSNWNTTDFSRGTVTITEFTISNWRLSKFDKFEMVAILNSMATRVGRFPATCTIGQYINYNAPEPEVVAAISALKAAHKEITTVKLVV